MDENDDKENVTENAANHQPPPASARPLKSALKASSKFSALAQSLQQHDDDTDVTIFADSHGVVVKQCPFSICLYRNIFFLIFP